jgi:hypothetical protein
VQEPRSLRRRTVRIAGHRPATSRAAQTTLVDPFSRRPFYIVVCSRHAVARRLKFASDRRLNRGSRGPKCRARCLNVNRGCVC